MVDFIKITAKVPFKYLNENKWNVKPANHEKRKNFYFDQNFDDTDRYEKKAGKIYFEYFPISETFYLSGRVISTIEPSHYKNFDDYNDIKSEVEKVYNILNEALKLLFKPEANLDVRKMRATQIEFSFNIITEHKDQYIKLFNKIYKKNKNGKFKNYIDFTDDKKKKSNTSFYLKTKSDYEKNEHQNFCLNIYNKHNKFLTYLRKTKNKNKDVVLDDIVNTYEILRIECKAYYQYLKAICKREGIENRLENFMDLNISRNAVNHKLEWFFGTGDFYSKKFANKKFEESGKNIDLEKDISQLGRSQAYERKKKFESEGICPYIFIPENWGIKMLSNPIKLIEKKVEDIKS